MAKHTPGPWTIKDRYIFGPINIEYTGIPTYFDVATVNGSLSSCINGNNNQSKFDAHLIAAAPELLEALKAIAGKDMDSLIKMCKIGSDFHDTLTAFKEISEKAIAKAEGRE